MKRFVFPLDRVLRFRRQQLETEEGKFRQTQSQHAYLERRASRLDEQASSALRRAGQQHGLSGADLTVLDTYRTSLSEDSARTRRACEQLEKMKRSQLNEIVHARRAVRLLEILRERKRRSHEYEQQKQLDGEAAELHLARQRRRQQPGAV